MDCLEEKSNEVIQLQKKLQTLALETAEKIRRRKQDFIDDELAEVREILGEAKLNPEKEDIRKERKGHQRKKTRKSKYSKKWGRRY
jgi:predicted transposase YbfD/YdcC